MCACVDVSALLLSNSCSSYRHEAESQSIGRPFDKHSTLSASSPTYNNNYS